MAAVRDLTHGGADYVFDCIGLPETVTEAVAMLGVAGSAVVVGLTALGAQNLRIYEYQGIIALFTAVDDEHALVDIDLRGGKTDTIGRVHRFQ